MTQTIGTEWVLGGYFVGVYVFDSFFEFVLQFGVILLIIIEIESIIHIV